MSKKTLGPPKGAQQTAEAARSAVLGSRFSDAQSRGPAAEAEAGTAVSETSHTPVHTPHTSVRQRRGEPEGMTRKTYYLPQEAAAMLDDAVERIQAALGGRTARHEALAAIIAIGAGHVDQIIDQLRAELLRDLT